MRIAAQVHRSRWQLAGIAAFTVVSLLLTLLVAGTLASGGHGNTTTFKALFRDATGLKKGDDVRIAGVLVGSVEDIRLEGKHALVTFRVEEDQPVYDTSVATIDYLNLMGQRYVELSRPAEEGRRLADGATIPLERTAEGLDLTAMFNAFKPLFELIQPDDVNRLADNIIQVFQGQGGALQHLTDQTARLTSTLADRDEVIGAVIENVSAVMDTVAEHRTEMSAMVGQLDDLTGTIAGHKEQIGATIDGVSGLVEVFSGLVSEMRPTVDKDVAALGGWATSFARQSPRIRAALTDVQLLLATYVKTLGLGSYLNTYVCKSSIQLGDSGPTISLSPSSRRSDRCR